jgi:hypothetical protein
MFSIIISFYLHIFILVVLPFSAEPLTMEQSIFKRIDVASDKILSSLSECEKETFVNNGYYFLDYLYCTRNVPKFGKKDYKIINDALTDDMARYLKRNFGITFVQFFYIKQYLVYSLASEKMKANNSLLVYSLKNSILNFKAAPQYHQQVPSSANLVTIPDGEKLKSERYALSDQDSLMEQNIADQLDTLSGHVMLSLSECEKETIKKLDTRKIAFWLFFNYGDNLFSQHRGRPANFDLISDSMTKYLFKKYSFWYGFTYEFKQIITFIQVAQKLQNRDHSMDACVELFIEIYGLQRREATALKPPPSTPSAK